MNRKEWEEMWNSIKEIERIIQVFKKNRYHKYYTIQYELNKMKTQVQSVIGQME